MIKKGFTLQELLISLAIVGIVAAIAAPAITALMPDKKKAMYMKAYNTLTNVTNEIINDPSLYWVKYDESGQPINSNILENTDAPIDYEPCEGDWSCSGAAKFSRIFATKINYIERTAVSNSETTFRTSDGVFWEFRDGLNPIIVYFNVDPDGDEDKDCYFDSVDCTDPNKFRFAIYTDGRIVVSDSLGQAFLRNPSDMNSIQKDKDLAKTLNTKY